MTSTSHTFTIQLITSFIFNDTATTEIYTLSLHDALPISHLPVGRHRQRRPLRRPVAVRGAGRVPRKLRRGGADHALLADRKSTRLNSSHANISYAVFCLKNTHHISTQDNNAYVLSLINHD